MESKIISALKNKKGRELTESTINLYLKQLKSLNDNQPLKNFNFLKDSEDIDDKIKDYKPNTQRNKLIAVVSVLKELPGQKKLFDIYFEKLNNLNQNIQKNDNGEKSETQKNNWIEWSDVLEIKNKLLEQVNQFKSKKILSKDQYNILLKLLVLSLYTEQAPRRNADFQKMIVSNAQPKELQKINYLILKPTMKFIYNNYKSIRTHGQQEFNVPEELQNIIKLYLKHRNNKTDYFIVDYEGNPLKNINSMTYLLNNIFGKKISSSMLRHIYLSKYQNINEEQKADSKAMAHTLATQAYYIRK